jgi:hypothetical protein
MCVGLLGSALLAGVVGRAWAREGTRERAMTMVATMSDGVEDWMTCSFLGQLFRQAFGSNSAKPPKQGEDLPHAVLLKNKKSTSTG